MANETNDRAISRRRNPKPQPKTNAPHIVRTSPKDFDRRRFLLRISSIVAIVLAASIGLSIFFRVDTVTVTGCNKYTAWTVSEASGVQKGDSLLFFGKATTGARIMAKLPYIKSVRFRITLPGTVHILVEEAAVAYSLQDAEGNWWLMTSDGMVVEQTDEQSAKAATVISGVLLKEPAVGQQAQAYEDPDATTAATGADRLTTVLQIIVLLEDNELLGDMSSIDVENLQQLRMHYGDRFAIKLGDRQELDAKIATVRGGIAQMGSYQIGVMELSKDGEMWKILFTSQD